MQHFTMPNHSMYTLCLVTRQAKSPNVIIMLMTWMNMEQKKKEQTLITTWLQHRGSKTFSNSRSLQNNQELCFASTHFSRTDRLKGKYSGIGGGEEHITPKSPTGVVVQSSQHVVVLKCPRRPQHMIHIIFIFKPSASLPLPIRIERFHHRINMIVQNNFVLICSDTSCKDDKWIQTMTSKCPQSVTEPPDVPFLWCTPHAVAHL